MDPAKKLRTENGRRICSVSYRGHQIAAVQDGDAWLVVLNDVLQHDNEFGSPEEAAAWLRRAIDAQIAEEIYPGLAFEQG